MRLRRTRCDGGGWMLWRGIVVRVCVLMMVDGRFQLSKLLHTVLLIVLPQLVQIESRVVLIASRGSGGGGDRPGHIPPFPT